MALVILQEYAWLFMIAQDCYDYDCQECPMIVRIAKTLGIVRKYNHLMNTHDCDDLKTVKNMPWLIMTVMIVENIWRLFSLLSGVSQEDLRSIWRVSQ
jgi:hypothetical protein